MLGSERASGYIKDNSSIKETMSTWVINVSTLLFISFIIYSSFNFFHPDLSHMTLSYTEAGTRRNFRRFFQVMWTMDP